MVSPISPYARAYVRARATEVMEYTCRIERVTPATIDEITLVATAGTRTTIYTGVCRIWEITGSSMVVLGDADVDMQTTQLSTPWDAAVAQKDDEVVILTAPTQDSTMAGKRFQIQSQAFAGELRATRRYNVTAVQ